MRCLRASIVFLTRIPVRLGPKGFPPFHKVVAWFPITGALIGCAVGFAYFGLSQLLPSALSAAIAIAFGVAVTGAFHLDGLADSADAFAGGSTVERRLEILKDSRLGTYGTSALALALLIEMAALGSLGPSDGLIGLISAHAGGRSAALFTMVFARQAAQEGLGADYISAVTWPRGLAGVLAGVTILIVLNGPKGLLLLTFALPAIVIISAWSYRSIGGLVGDSLGAIAQLAQMSLLIGSVALTDGSCDCSW